MFSVYSLFQLTLSIRDKKGEKQLKCGNPVCFVYGDLKFFLKGGEYKKFFDVSNLGEELVYFCFYICVPYCLYVFLSKHAVICSFECFQERQVHSDQDILPLLATSRLGVLDQNFCCIWAFLLYWVVLVFEHFILYVSFVTNCQRGRLLGSKSLE